VADRDAIVRVALDYFEGWFDGDAARMERTLHPNLAKRSPDDAPAPGELEKLTAREMIEATAKGVRIPPPGADARGTEDRQRPLAAPLSRETATRSRNRRRGR
jgi:hypothetical protein